MSDSAITLCDRAIGRRAFLGGAAAMLAGAATPGLAARGGKPFFASHELPVGIQLYTVAAELLKDLDGTLAAVAKIGYRTVELAGYAGKTPTELRAALDRAGLRCTSSHIIGKPIRPNTPLTLDNDPAKLAEDCHILGCDTIIMPLFNIPDGFSVTPRPGEDLAAVVSRLGAAMTPDGWKRSADYLNIKAAALAKHGIRLGFHNHNIEFAGPRGQTGFDLLLRGTDPKLVSFELDVGWAVAAGQDPVALMRAYPHRFSAFHVKDVHSVNSDAMSVRQDPAEIGAGIIDWKTLLPFAYRNGVHRFFVEQEPPFSKPPLESAALSFAYLNTLVTA